MLCTAVFLVKPPLSPSSRDMRSRTTSSRWSSVRCEREAPTPLAASCRMVSFVSASNPMRTPNPLSSTGAEILAPEKRTTACSASTMASCTPTLDDGSSMPLTSSLTIGSTRGEKAMSLPRPSAARVRTALDGSDSDLTNVGCSCGRNGFTNRPPLSMMMPRVCRMALFTLNLNLSDTMRMRGPVILVRNGRSDSVDVYSTSSPMPVAASSRMSSLPCIRACWYTGSSGARPLGRQNPRSNSGP